MPFEECEIATVCHENIRKARKQHKCCECKQPILIGERYANMFMIYDGIAEDFKQHLCCWSLCRKINHEIVDSMDHGQCAYNFGEIHCFFDPECSEGHGEDLVDNTFSIVEFAKLVTVWEGIKNGDRSYRREADKDVV